MNKRRRFKAKRRRLVKRWQDIYNNPWRYEPDYRTRGKPLAVTRYEARKRLESMGAWQ